MLFMCLLALNEKTETDMTPPPHAKALPRAVLGWRMPDTWRDVRPRHVHVEAVNSLGEDGQ